MAGGNAALDLGTMLSKRARLVGTVLRARPLEKVGDQSPVRPRGRAAVRPRSVDAGHRSALLNRRSRRGAPLLVDRTRTSARSCSTSSDPQFLVAGLRFASGGSYSLRSTIGASRTRRRTAPPSASLWAAPARCARQSVLRAPGGALRRPPPHFERLLLASLDNRCLAHPAAHCADHPAQIARPRFRAAPARFARQSCFAHPAAHCADLRFTSVAGLERHVVALRGTDVAWRGREIRGPCSPTPPTRATATPRCEGSRTAP